MTLSESNERSTCGTMGAQLKRRAAKVWGHLDGSCAALTAHPEGRHRV
jgi:hypothetical protein